ncbi:endothelin-converting enzyme homolog [Xenia sp. Carnegie-2017]|uniref:endothelin-converting enzyme homolog n=1 Tax=Xenia sp. Carnegie-2017 TaxID=2897299 RepID=UPI001F043DAC|nr:endothelin-converting enzyme homolog [Xenia sp. Carnegie-2017]
MEEMDGSNYNLVTGTLRPSKSRIITGILVTFVALLLVLSITFVVLYIHEKNTGDANVGNSPGARKVVNVPTTSGKTFRHSKIDKVCYNKSCIVAAGEISKKLDPTVNPCDDFYQYSCGGFVKNNFIPDEFSSLSSFTIVNERVQDKIANFLNNGYSKKISGTAIGKMFDYYHSCMNVKYIENSDQFLIHKLLNTYVTNLINELPSLEITLGRVLGNFGQGVLVTCGVTPVPEDTSRNKLAVGGGVVGMIQKLSMTDEDQPEENVLEEGYKQYMNKTFQLLGYSSFVDVLQIEKKFLSIRYHGDKKNNYPREMTVAKLKKYTEHKFDWLVYLNEVMKVAGKSINEDTEVLVYSPAKLKLIIDFMTKYQARTIANEIAWVIVNSMMTALPKGFRDARNDYVSLVTGVESPLTRRRTCVEETNLYFEYPIAKLYGEKYVSEEARKRAFNLFHEIRMQFIEGLNELQWMDYTSRAKARLKLEKMKESVGYPLFVKDTAKLNKMYKTYLVDGNDFFNNKLRVLKARFVEYLKTMDSPPDDKRFPSPPTAVNAYYYPLKNKMYILAGILEKPFYEPDHLKALNYGSIGMVVGHEMTHGFDFKGRLYDEKGNLKPWMTTKAKHNFLTKAICLLKEYNNTYVYGRKLNGLLTLSENIADNGGLKYAYRAYMKWRKTNGEEAKLPGLNFNNEQLFFIAFAQTWCTKYRNKVIDYNLKHDPHSLDPARVRVPLSNFPQFSKAFNCKAPKHTCVLW